MAKDGITRGYLPPYYRPAVGPVVTRTGCWDDKGDDAFLEMLIHAMPQGRDLKLADLVSLPHIWGQTLAFTVAWHDPGHDMHLMVRGEWRGLLALIGLAGWEEWPVSVVEVNLDDLTDRPFVTTTVPLADSGETRSLPNFPKVVKHSLPDNAAIGAPAWKNSAVILYDSNAISRPERSSDARSVGFCAPRSLVVPARNYKDVLDARIPWRSDRAGGYPLRDPLDCDGRCVLSRIQLEVLWKFLEKVKGRVIDEARKQVESDSPHVGFLLKMLGEYMTDIEKEREKQNVKAPSSMELLGRWDDERFRGFNGLYFNVLNSIPGRPVERVPMETRIDSLTGLSPDFKGVVLYGAGLIREPGLTPRDVLVWGAHTLEDMGEEPAHFGSLTDISRLEMPGRRGTMKAQERTRQGVRQEALAAGYLLLHVDELFYPDILRMRDVPDGHNRRWDGWLPPIRPVALTIFTVEYLRENLNIEDVGGDIRVTLRLDGLGMKNRVGVGLRYRLEKTYRKNNTLVEAPSVLAVWPDFESTEWHHYGIFHLRDSDRELDVRPLPAVEDWMPAFVSAWKNGDSLPEFFGALPHDDRFMEGGCGRESGHDYRGYWFRRRPGVLAGSVNGGQTLRQGLILLPPAKLVETSGKEVVVGLDIGSTNTAAAWLLPGINHQQNGGQVEIQPMLSFLFDPTDKHRELIEDMFGFPVKPKRAPFLSLLKERREGRGRRAALPAIDYRIPWPLLETLDFDSIDNNPHQNQTYICDLKWAQRREAANTDFEVITNYLTLLMRLIGAGIVRNRFPLRTANWRFSYPETFTTAEVESFRGAINRQIAELNQPHRSPVREPGTPPVAVVARKECESVTGFFIRRYGNVAQSNTVIVFDVGGRNTDVAIWHQNEIRWNGTLSLASRDTMIDFLMANSHLLHPIFHELADKYRNLMNSTTKDDAALRRMLTELLVQDPRFLDWQVQNSGPQGDLGHVARLRDIATFTLAGLLNYTALAFAETLLNEGENGKMPRPYDDAPISVQICFGGRGSLLFQRFISTDLHEQLIKWFYERIATFLKRTSSETGEPLSADSQRNWIYPPVIFNDRTKREVSEGLLLEPAPEIGKAAAQGNGADVQSAADRTERKPLYLGEAVKPPPGKGSGMKDYFESLSRDDLKASSTWVVHDLMQFTEFVKSFQQTFGIPLGPENQEPAERLDDLVRAIIGSTRREFDKECEFAAKDYGRSRRYGDARTYQPQPVFILALRAALEHLNRQPSERIT